jgi:hypothetical protein
MRKLWMSAGVGALVLVLTVVAVAMAHGGGARHGGQTAHLDGYQEVPPISTTATGRFKAKIAGDHIDYKLSYSGFTSDVQFAHIHFGQFAVEGGVLVFLCGGGGKPACPATSGEVTGTIVPADVHEVAAQGFTGTADELFAKLVDAIKHGATYANVHSTQYPDGEIRGQIFGSRGGFGKFGKFGHEGHEGGHGEGDYDRHHKH